jgi:A/G-specific adenine glycosylase
MRRKTQAVKPTRDAKIQEKLVGWFESGQRDLPWRRSYQPYAVWISEIMLQQTQVKTVLPYYDRWMRRFPDIRAVADAPEEEILKLWEGLGYYSRARNIQKTARLLIREHQGDLPRDHRALLDLPGIGRYTAGAIMSVAFNEDFPLVDGNVERVLARVFEIDSPLGEQGTRQALWRIAERLVPPGRARPFNQGMMELGALVCLPKNPLCPECPIQGECASFASGTVNQRPVPGRKRAPSPIDVAVGILVRGDGRILIQKRPPTGLMPHLWEFPGGKVQDGEGPDAALIREFLEELELRVHRLDRLATLRHSYTSFRVTLHAFFCEPVAKGQKPVPHAAVDIRWVTPEELRLYAFPAANKKLIRML